MRVDFTNAVKKGQTVAVAVSGGSDSMALLHYTFSNGKKLQIKVIAINVEHGIRGDASKSDSRFVKSYCEKKGIPLLEYCVDSLSYAKKEKLSIEQSARILRYNCFFDAINTGKCDVVATAHHLKDNVESVLINLFRGTGIKGVAGIDSNYSDKIIRPFLSVTKEEISEYIAENSIPFITDETNFSDDYTRNNLRINLLPKIKEIFPEVEKSISRFAEIATLENDFIEKETKKNITLSPFKAEIPIDIHPAVFNRAVILGLKHLGIEKDWEKAHIDSVYGLIKLENGSAVSLPKNIVAIKEYDKIVLYLPQKTQGESIPFNIGSFTFANKNIKIEKFSLSAVDLQKGLYADIDKIPASAVIRVKGEGDLFTKFGGGTKKLNDYLTDKKIPLRIRDNLPILANGKNVLAIFNVGISDLIKADKSTKLVVKFTCEDK